MLEGDHLAATRGYSRLFADIALRVAQREALFVTGPNGIGLVPNSATVIPGARDPVEVDENLRLIAHPIPAALWTDLAAAGLLRADAVPAG